MKYSDLEKGFAYFTDFETQKVIQDPVYFTNFQEKILPNLYERTIVKRLFAELDEDKEKQDDYAQISKTPERYLLYFGIKALVKKCKENEKIRKLIEKEAATHLNGNSIDDLLANLESLESLVGVNDPRCESIRSCLEKAYLETKNKCLNTAFSVLYPNTQTRLYRHAQFYSAMLFKNVFLIAARNAVEADPNEFQGKPLTETLYAELEKLSADDIKNAEQILEFIYNNKRVDNDSIATEHKELLRSWNIHKNNPMVRPSQQRAQFRFAEHGFKRYGNVREQLKECKRTLKIIEEVETLPIIVNSDEKEHYLLLLKQMYKQFLRHLAPLISLTNFLDIEDFLLFQADIDAEIAIYSQLTPSISQEQEAYKIILITISEKLQNAIDTAKRQFIRLPFHQETDKVAAYQKICKVLNSFDKLALSEMTNTHYRRLLLEAIKSLKIPSIQNAEARFSQHRFNATPDLKEYRTLIQTALINLDNSDHREPLEIHHYHLLLIQEGNNISRRIAEDHFFNFLLTKLSTGDLPIADRIDLGELSSACFNLAQNEAERMHYQALLMCTVMDALPKSLSVGKKAAEGRFDKLKLFDTDDYSQMKCNIQAAFNEQSSISDAEEATHFRVLVGQAQKVSDCLSSISQCMNDAENLVAKADGLCKTARIKTTAANVKKDLSASLEKAIEASYDLGAACQKLTTAGDEAYGIFPGMATDPVNTQTKIEQISANVQNIFASMQKQFQSIQGLYDQIVSKACSLQTEDNSQASQLAMLQQQLDKATEFELPEASTRALLMQMQQEAVPKEIRLETAEEQRRHILG